MFKIYNQEGRAFHVRIVCDGDCYGFNDGLIHGEVAHTLRDDASGKALPMVEFYDTTGDSKVFGERGQFVTRYHVSTLEDVTGGLCLDGGIPVWTLDASAVEQAKRYVREVLRPTHRAGK